VKDVLFPLKKHRLASPDEDFPQLCTGTIVVGFGGTVRHLQALPNVEKG
jgi:hypothetical protein